MQKNYCSFFSYVIVMVCLSSCNSFWGDHYLGEHFSLFDGDEKDERVIIYCDRKNGQACNSGVYVIPSDERQKLDAKDGQAEYVEDASDNKDWIVAKTKQTKDKKENYWILNKNFNIEGFDCNKANCDSIIQSHLTGPLDFINFQKKIKSLNIDLNLK